MPRVQLVGDFVKDRFVIAPQPGRKGWTEQTISLDRPGGVFQTRALLANCYSDVRMGRSYLPRFVPECPEHNGNPEDGDPTFYWQMFEVDPKTGLTVRVLQRRLFKREKPWSITSQLARLEQVSPWDVDVLFVEQEEYTTLSREQETRCIFDFASRRVSKLLLRTNQPHLALKIACDVQLPATTVIITTLRALDGDTLDSHTWDGAVRCVVEKLGNFPKQVRVGVELWNEGCTWLTTEQGFLFWDMESPLGAQRLSGKGWLPGLTNVSCASLLSLAGMPDWPTMEHMRESWILSRQCGLLGPQKENEIVDLPKQLRRLLELDKTVRPRADMYGTAKFNRSAQKEWNFLAGLQVGGALVQNIVKSGQKAIRDIDCPFLSIGRLFEIEESKIEQLLKLNHLLRDYASRRFAPRPLSIAVFGPPGSGKSFAITELAKNADLQAAPMFLSYNLSQFHSVDDLEPAFHAVQSAVLRGRLPFVFWDEFDSELDGRTLGWLKHFLAPMQDGEFFARGVAHPLGRCVFIFAGATEQNFDKFRERQDQSCTGAKLPDFVSRIKAWLTVSPLPSPETSAGRLLRAMGAHTLIRQHAPHVIGTVDLKVLEFLLSGECKTMRDMERIIEAAALNDTNRFTRGRLLFNRGKN